MAAQAAHFISTVGAGCPLLAADHEDADVSLANLKDFLAAVLSLTGKRAVIYSGNVIKDQLGDTHDGELAKHRLWIAHYASTPTWPSATWPQWWLWQYTDAGTVDGVVGSVDRDRFDGSVYDLANEWDGSFDPPAPPQPKPDDKLVTITIDVPAGVTVQVVQHNGG
jgi:GH25 family lysozyme M1 (1,4-beta-N-acetylmuramidase)